MQTPNDITAVLERLLPVGSIVEWSPVDSGKADLSTPEKVAAYYGFGTWERLQGCFLYAESAERPAGTTGGSEFHAHTLGDSGYAYIGPQYTQQDGDCLCYKVPVKVNAFSGYKLLTNSSQSSMTGFVNATPLGGSTNSQQYLPPYLAVYMWKRTA